MPYLPYPYRAPMEVPSPPMTNLETVVLCVCVTMSQEDMIFSHVYLNVYVVSLITKLFYKFSLKAFTQS